jgi:hypothetical protein
MQLASIIGFLLDKHPEWLDKIALGLSEGWEMRAIIADLETDFNDLQNEWLTWGKKVFAPDSKPPAGPGTHFPVPPEWREKKNTDPQKGENSGG